MNKYDVRCTSCAAEYEELRRSGDPVTSCPVCDKPGRIIWKSVPILDKAKDPYDLLHGAIPDAKPIKSFANDRRKGGKDR